eukprot:7307793-Alexandrium_andersonii.AAC.1
METGGNVGREGPDAEAGPDPIGQWAYGKWAKLLDRRGPGVRALAGRLLWKEDNSPGLERSRPAASPLSGAEDGEEGFQARIGLEEQ